MPGPGSRGKTRTKNKSKTTTAASAATSSSSTTTTSYIVEIDNAEGWNVIVAILCDYFELPGNKIYLSYPRSFINKQKKFIPFF